MTEQDLKQSLNIVSTNYNRSLDENIMTLWKALFINFETLFFKRACLKVIATCKFFPNANEIIDAYQFVKHEAERERYEKMREEQRLLVDNQTQCYLCDNLGNCFYMVSGYEYSARCICSHGRDLNRFSQSQIKQDYIPELLEHYPERDKAIIRRGGNPFYIPTVQEALKDNYAIFEARKKEHFLSKKAINNEQRAEILENARCGRNAVQLTYWEEATNANK